MEHRMEDRLQGEFKQLSGDLDRHVRILVADEVRARLQLNGRVAGPANFWQFMAQSPILGIISVVAILVMAKALDIDLAGILGLH